MEMISMPTHLNQMGWQFEKRKFGKDELFIAVNGHTGDATLPFADPHMALSAIYAKFCPSASQPLSQTQTYLVHVELLDDNPWQTRLRLDPDYVKKLSLDIKQRGLMQAPTGRIVLQPEGWHPTPRHSGDLSASLRQVGARVELAFGHNRAAAYKLLFQAKVNKGFELIPIQIRVLTDEAMANMAWSENASRKDLNPLEEAMAIQKRMKDFGWKQTEIAKVLQLNKATVSNKLKILQLPDTIQDQVRNSELSERQAMALMPLYKLPPERRSEDIGWMTPNKIFANASKWTSDEIRKNVSTALQMYSTEMTYFRFPLNVRIESEGIRSPTCVGCSDTIKIRRDGVDRCLYSGCREKKLKAWMAHVEQGASQKSGVPIMPDSATWDVQEILSNWQAEELMIEGCQQLRVYFHGSDDGIIEDWPQAGLACYHPGEKKCACLLARHKAELQAAKETPEAITRKEEMKKSSSYILPTEKALADGLSDGNVNVWRRLLKNVLPNAKVDEMNLSRIELHLAKWLIRKIVWQKEDSERTKNDLTKFLNELNIDIPWNE